MEILIGVASALGGAFLTSVSFIIGFSGKVSAMQSTLNRLEKSFNEHLSFTPTCQFHNEINAEIQVLKSKDK